MGVITHAGHDHVPWNKGQPAGQKPPLKLKKIWAIRIRLQLARSIRDLALFNLAIDSKCASMMACRTMVSFLGLACCSDISRSFLELNMSHTQKF